MDYVLSHQAGEVGKNTDQKFLREKERERERLLRDMISA
jgi:hypothetical protein